MKINGEQKQQTAGGSHLSAVAESRRFTGRRTPPRLDTVFDQYESPLYFVTICTAGRRRWLANATVQERFLKFAERGQERGIAVGRYVLMPDHIHLFVAGGRDFDLGTWVRLLKGILADGAGRWQRGFFDHLVRHDESYGEKWEYVRQNPVRAGLVKRAEDWPYRGEVVAIDRA
jgi:REP element-mobilizing transposase RayT